MEGIDSRFLLEHFLSDDEDTKSKTSRHLKAIIDLISYLR